MQAGCKENDGFLKFPGNRPPHGRQIFSLGVVAIYPVAIGQHRGAQSEENNRKNCKKKQS